MYQLNIWIQEATSCPVFLGTNYCFFILILHKWVTKVVYFWPYIFVYLRFSPRNLLADNTMINYVIYTRGVLIEIKPAA